MINRLIVSKRLYPIIPNPLQDNSEMYYMKGAPERVLQQCTSYHGQGSVVPLTTRDLEMFNDAVSAMSSRGLRGTHLVS